MGGCKLECFGEPLRLKLGDDVEMFSDKPGSRSCADCKTEVSNGSDVAAVLQGLCEGRQPGIVQQMVPQSHAGGVSQVDVAELGCLQQSQERLEQLIGGMLLSGCGSRAADKGRVVIEGVQEQGGRESIREFARR